MSEARAMTVAGFLDARLRAQTNKHINTYNKTSALNPFDDDSPVVQTCDTENPEACEACD